MKRQHFDIHAPVFYPTIIILLLFIGVTLFIGEPVEEMFSNIQSAITEKMGWLFILGVNIFLGLAVYLTFGRYGQIRLGGDKSRPSFSLFSWFSMLFSAGLGIGLLFYGVAEPIMHFSSDALNESPGSPEAANTAMQYTFLHYGFHAWAIYAVLGVALAFFAFNKKLPLTLRSLLYPVLGDKIYGWIGNTIDVIAVVATIFGLATSLGFGVKQVSAGFQYLLGTSDTIYFQIALIFIITTIATISLVKGLKKGIKRLSLWNFNLALVFLAVMIILGPTVFILDSFVQNLGIYLQDFIKIGTYTEATSGTDWQHNWTIFYWAWWIAWSPFVAMFIARISKGRTVKEFFLGVMLVPSLLSFLWMTVFGGAALYLELNGLAPIVGEVNENIATALFVMLEQYPLSQITSTLGIVLVISFFVTSSDSGSMVVDSITSGGKLEAPTTQRIFWAFMEGMIAAVLLFGGGLQALQTVTIISGLPFLILMLVMCYCLLIGFKNEIISKEINSNEIKKELIKALKIDSSGGGKLKPDNPPLTKIE